MASIYMKHVKSKKPKIKLNKERKIKTLSHDLIYLVKAGIITKKEARELLGFKK